jgi:hypothetical protein
MNKLTGRFLAHVFALLFALVSMQASAAPQAPGSDFNHATTGFALTGGHLTAACETCHIGGVFKGTPRNCDGCHAVGKRVVATPKSSSHIVTDAPCDTCHFNANTWLGARYNHGTAQRGSCQTCHNGRLSMPKPPSHNTGSKSTGSCDQCHRTYAWLPAAWNHSGDTNCAQAGCHVSGSNIYYRGSGTSHNLTGELTYGCAECHTFFSWSPARFTHNRGVDCQSCHNGAVAGGKPISHGAASIKGMNQCSDCHRIQGWLPATYNHGSPATCVTCHDGIKAVGKYPGHFATADDCNQCHTKTTAWLPALGAKPANHIPYNAGVQCTSCHVGGTVVRGTSLHVPYLNTFACTTCHLKNNAYSGWGQDTKSIGHEGMRSGDDCSKSGCHKPLGNKGSAYTVWD